MVFTRLAVGFVTGMTISMNCHDYVYMTIANCFVRPHWRYRKIKKERYSKEHAVGIELLDSYVKDAVSSFLLFWVIIGPVTYRAYFTKDPSGKNQNPHEVEDTYSTMLKSAYDRKEKL
jgi:hypothetical protein